MQVVKSVIQRYEATPDILKLLEAFREMVNDCIRIGLETKTTSLKSLSLKSYHQLKNYNLPTYYRLTAISKATGILKNYRKSLRKHPTKKPYCVKPMLIDCYARRIIDGKLRLPLTPRNYIYIPLNAHTLSVTSGHTLRSVTLTTCTISVCYSKEIAEMEPRGLIGVDRNLDNLTSSSTNLSMNPSTHPLIDSSVKIFNLSEATRIKSAYREVKSHFRRNDDRIKKLIYDKYGVKQRNKVKQIIHRATKAIVAEAKIKGLGIAMEKLTGLRKLYRKGNGQGNEYRSRLNGWSFYETQRQLEYKARWEGLKVIYVNPWGTSSHCAVCGSKVLESTDRMMYCLKCKTLVDRDINAARNIATRGVRFAPVGGVDEAMVPVQRWPVDAPQPSQVIAP